MADLTSRGRRANTPARLPALPASTATDPARRQWEEMVREWLEVRLGARGDFYERAVTHRELEDALASAASSTDNSDQTRLQALVAQLQSQLFGLARQLNLVQSLINNVVNTTNTDITNINTQLRGVAVEDVAVFAPQMRPSVTDGCDPEVTFEFAATQPNLVALPFLANVDTSADFTCMLPFSWAGRNFRIWVYWAHAGSGTAWDVAWEVTSNGAFDDEPLILDFLPGVLVEDTGGTPGNLYVAQSTAVPIASYENEAGSLVSLRITRRGTFTEDTMDITAYLLAVRFTLEDIPIGPPPETDPEFSSVVLLLHADTASPLTDHSASAHTITITGAPTISATDPQFGAGCFLFNGASGYVSAGTSADWQLGSGDFTIEFSLRDYTYQGAGFETPLVALWSSTTGLSWMVTANLSNQMTFYYVQGGSPVFTKFTTTGIVAGAAYKRYAITRNGSTLRFFYDGVVESTHTITGAIDSASSTQLTIGGVDYTSVEQLIGRLDEIRITKGVARYIADYTPATAPFLDA